MSHPKSKKERLTVKIVNPLPGKSGYTSRAHADRYIRRREAHFDSCGRLVFDVHGAIQRYREHGPLVDVQVAKLSGSDAMPDRAVLPPSPEWLARMGYDRCVGACKGDSAW